MNTTNYDYNDMSEEDLLCFQDDQTMEDCEYDSDEVVYPEENTLSSEEDSDPESESDSEDAMRHDVDWETYVSDRQSEDGDQYQCFWFSSSWWPYPLLIDEPWHKRINYVFSGSEGMSGIMFAMNDQNLMDVNVKDVGIAALDASAWQDIEVYMANIGNNDKVPILVGNSSMLPWEVLPMTRRPNYWLWKSLFPFLLDSENRGTRFQIIDELRNAVALVEESCWHPALVNQYTAPLIMGPYVSAEEMRGNLMKSLAVFLHGIDLNFYFTPQKGCRPSGLPACGSEGKLRKCGHCQETTYVMRYSFKGIDKTNIIVPNHCKNPLCILNGKLAKRCRFCDDILKLEVTDNTALHVCNNDECKQETPYCPKHIKIPMFWKCVDGVRILRCHQCACDAAHAAKKGKEPPKGKGELGKPEERPKPDFYMSLFDDATAEKKEEPKVVVYPSHPDIEQLLEIREKGIDLFRLNGSEENTDYYGLTYGPEFGLRHQVKDLTDDEQLYLAEKYGEVDDLEELCKEVPNEYCIRKRMEEFVTKWVSEHGPIQVEGKEMGPHLIKPAPPPALPPPEPLIASVRKTVSKPKKKDIEIKSIVFKPVIVASTTFISEWSAIRGLLFLTLCMISLYILVGICSIGNMFLFLAFLFGKQQLRLIKFPPTKYCTHIILAYLAWNVRPYVAAFVTVLFPVDPGSILFVVLAFIDVLLLARLCFVRSKIVSHTYYDTINPKQKLEEATEDLRVDAVAIGEYKHNSGLRYYEHVRKTVSEPNVIAATILGPIFVLFSVLFFYRRDVRCDKCMKQDHTDTCWKIGTFMRNMLPKICTDCDELNRKKWNTKVTIGEEEAFENNYEFIDPFVGEADQRKPKFVSKGDGAFKLRGEIETSWWSEVIRKFGFTASIKVGRGSRYNCEVQLRPLLKWDRYLNICSDEAIMQLTSVDKLHHYQKLETAREIVLRAIARSTKINIDKTLTLVAGQSIGSNSVCVALAWLEQLRADDHLAEYFR